MILRRGVRGDINDAFPAMKAGGPVGIVIRVIGGN
jgi:hypothetical protein